MSITERAERLAANLLADRQRDTSTTSSYAGLAERPTSIAAGAGRAKRQFLLDALPFDEGKATYEQQCEYERKLMGAALGAFVVVAGPPELEVGSKFYPGLGFSGMPMRRGSHGFYIACKHCNRELEN